MRCPPRSISPRRTPTRRVCSGLWLRNSRLRSSRMGMSRRHYTSGNEGSQAATPLRSRFRRPLPRDTIPPMRVLVISDIHANLAALEAVLAHAGSFDAAWCLGDLVGYGPDPNEVIRRV